MTDYVQEGDLQEHIAKVVQLEREASPFSFNITRARDLKHDDLLKNWVVDDLLGEGEYTAIYGLPGSGKSVLITDIGLHIAAGREWMGRAVNQGLVVFLAAERANLTKRRSAAWIKHHDVPEDLPYIVLDGVFDLINTTDKAEEIVRAIRVLEREYGVPPRLVVIDTKAQVMGGANPNADDDVGSLNQSVRIIQQTGAHVSLVDHVPHSAPDRLKGSGALAGAVDGSFLVKNDEGTRTLAIGSKPPNDGPYELEIRFQLHSVRLGYDSKGKVTEAPVVQQLLKDPRLDPDTPLPSGRRDNLKPPGQKVLSAFWRLIESGRSVPAPQVDVTVSSSTRAVTLDALRDMAFEMGLHLDPEPKPGAHPSERTRWRSARNKAWERGIGDCVNAQELRCERGVVWKVEKGVRFAK